MKGVERGICHTQEAIEAGFSSSYLYATKASSPELYDRIMSYDSLSEFMEYITEVRANVAEMVYWLDEKDCWLEFYRSFPKQYTTNGVFKARMNDVAFSASERQRVIGVTALPKTELALEEFKKFKERKDG